MKWSWKIAKVAGIDVFVHATFLLLFAWVGLTHWLGGRTLESALTGILFISALFACVLLHELGHALAARRFGIPTRDITLLPIGGVARLERMPEQPRQEFWVAVAGPAVNLAIAALLFLWLAVSNSLVPLAGLTVASGPFLERLLVANVFLVLFNLLPAFPMDGGRILRAALASRMEYTRATQIAAGLGQGMAFLFGFAGLFWNPFLLFIALFVWIGAAQEAAATQMKSALAGIPVNRAMMTEFETLQPEDTLSAALDRVLAGSQQDFPVLDRGELVGVLTRQDLLAAVAERGQWARVDQAMQRDFHVADAAEMLEVVFGRCSEHSCHAVPVMHHGRLVGLMTMENVGEFLMVQDALQGKTPKLRQLTGAAGRA